MKYKYYGGKDRASLQALLRNCGFRSTEGRLALLALLKHAHHPLSVSHITKELRSNLDEVNVYRAIEALSTKGLVVRSDVRTGGARYEYPHSHHHHLVCSDCGLTEDVKDCADKRMEKKVLQHSKAFRAIKTHALEFFGLCNSCAPQSQHA
jgi:Fur family ferric uptake transcriptional regulator